MIAMYGWCALGGDQIKTIFHGSTDSKISMMIQLISWDDEHLLIYTPFLRLKRMCYDLRQFDCWAYQHDHCGPTTNTELSISQFYMPLKRWKYFNFYTELKLFFLSFKIKNKKMEENENYIFLNSCSKLYFIFK